MAKLSALLSGATGLLLIVLLGNPPVSREVFERRGDVPDVIVDVFAFPRWDLDRLPDEVTGPTVVRLLLFIVVVAILGGLAGTGSRVAAFVGGWAASFLAAALASGAYFVSLDERYGGRPGQGVLDRFTQGMGTSTAFGLWTGWIVGVAVLVGSLLHRPRHDAPPPPPLPPRS